MEQALYPGTRTPEGVVAYPDGPVVWVFTITGPRPYRLEDLVPVRRPVGPQPARPVRPRVQLRLVA